MSREAFGQCGFAAEWEVVAMLDDNVLPTFGTLVCLRRSPPAWWSRVSSTRPDLALEHIPIPPSLDPGCMASLRQFIDNSLPRLAFPLLVFCKEGRHRSGMVEAMLLIKQGCSVDDAIERYVARSRGGARDREIALIRRLAENL